MSKADVERELRSLISAFGYESLAYYDEKFYKDDWAAANPVAEDVVSELWPELDGERGD